jgi:hypothetical protein
MYSSLQVHAKKWQKSNQKVSPAGNRTPVSRVTGGDTDHYTTEDLFRRGEKFCILRNMSVVRSAGMWQWAAGVKIFTSPGSCYRLLWFFYCITETSLNNISPIIQVVCTLAIYYHHHINMLLKSKLQIWKKIIFIKSIDKINFTTNKHTVNLQKFLLVFREKILQEGIQIYASTVKIMTLMKHNYYFCAS